MSNTTEQNANGSCLSISAHSPGHPSSTTAGFVQVSYGSALPVQALHKPSHPEVLDMRIPLSRPSLTSTAHPRPLMICPHSIAEYFITQATERLSVYSAVSLIAVSSTTGHTEESRHHAGWICQSVAQAW